MYRRLSSAANGPGEVRQVGVTVIVVLVVVVVVVMVTANGVCV